MTGTGEGKRRFMHYAPGELCIAIAAKGDGGRPEEQHEEVRRELNAVLSPERLDHPTFARSDFAADLTFAALRERLRRAGTGGLFQTIELTGTRTPPERSVLLPPAEGKAGAPTSLHFYRIAGTSRRARSHGDDPVVRELATFLNVAGDRLGLMRETDARRWHVLGATPNWLMAGAQEDETEAGPGAKPEPGEAKSARFKFGNPDLTTQIEKGSGNGVVVAVLDTSPTKEQVSRAAADRRGNWLLKEVAQRVKLDGPLSIDRGYFQSRLRHTVVRWRVPLPPPTGSPDQFKMPDHGLFAAGIIHSLVPGAEIHLIRVLGDYGTGDLLALTGTLAKLPSALLRDGSGRPNNKRLVVNMSLMADLPPGVSLKAKSPRGDQAPSKEFLDFWLPETSAGKSEKALQALLEQSANAAVARAIKRTHVSLQETVRWLHTQALLVGAAGNDALGRTRPPATRLPARYDNVLGVGAVTRRGRSAHYSNRGDEHEMGDGVATFGGDAHLTAVPNTPPEIGAEWVTGVFSADQFPLGGAANCTGWARWAGTSFAAPIISGIAASVWSTRPTLSPRSVMRRVIAFRQGGNAALTCPWIQAEQEP